MFKACKLDFNSDLLHLSFATKAVNNLVYSSFDIEHCYIFGEIIFLLAQNGVVQYIVHKEVNKLGC